MAEMFEVQVHRDGGADESFEVATEAEARRMAIEEMAESCVRRVVIVATGSGRIVDDYS